MVNCRYYGCNKYRWLKFETEELKTIEAENVWQFSKQKLIKSDDDYKLKITLSDSKSVFSSVVFAECLKIYIGIDMNTFQLLVADLNT